MMPRLLPVLAAAAVAVVARPSTAQPDRAGEVRVRPPGPREYRGGLRMEGSARLEIIYGDAADLKRTVDRFFELEARMGQTRQHFTRDVRGALAVLNNGGHGCPTEKLAPLFAAAQDSLEQFWTDGAELEAASEAIAALDRAGETAALTPDYRWRINRTRVTYLHLRADLREMRGEFSAQLVRELRARGCRPTGLAAGNPEGEPPPVTLPMNPPPAPPKPEPKAAAPAPPARATFFVDNRTCTAPVAVFVDGDPLGAVGGGDRGAFRALPGHHSMCLIPSTSPATCGATGTIRNVFISDGWAITIHCMK
ncbi:MAG TPA: hypothetical protein VL172_13390 [Kofleriaceae bacterium]|nr:hypothetical protein [Kofleriaceae bacterium]